MVGFNNRYMVMEVFLEPKKDCPPKHSSKTTPPEDPIVITQDNLSEAIRDSIHTNFGECGLASSMNSFKYPFPAVKYVNPTTKVCIFRTSREDYQKVWAAITMVKSIKGTPAVFNLLDLSGCLKASKIAALKCEQSKFEQHKILAGNSISADTNQQVQNCLDKIKTDED